MECIICKKELHGDELQNINELCFECQRILEWIYEEQDYEDKPERLEAVVDYLKNQRGDDHGRDE